MSAAYIAAFSLLAGNWACVLLGYPATVASPLWSVSIEEQFYLAWPLVLRKWFHCLPRVLIGLLVLASLTRFVLVALHVMHPGIWCNTFARLDPIAAGALLAVLSHGEALKLTWRSRLALLFVGVLLFIMAGRFGNYFGVGSLMSYPTVAVASVMLIAGTLSPQGGKQPQLLRGIAFLGQISYGLYVFHLAILHLIQTYGLHPLLTAPVALVCTVFVAGFPIISWRARSSGSRNALRGSDPDQ